ncbi:RHS repeat-associated core domain-containing protein [Proteus mirabilis]
MNASQFVTPVIDRRYRWDKRNQLIERSVSYGQTGEVFTAGHWYYHSYQYDPLGQLTAHLGSVQTEHFLYDAAANLLTRPHSEAPHNQVQGSDKFDYRYDGFGRMVSRYEKGSSSGQRYHYDSDHRIIAVDIDQGPLGYQRAEYRYDILGRRIEKRLWKASAIANTVTYHQHEPDEVYTFGWVGMRLVSEHSSAAPHTTVYHAYNDQSYTPLARIECTDNPLNPQRAIYYTHSSLSGLPEALTNSEGEIVWQGQYSAWGHLQRQTRPTSTFNREQNLRFQGQYFDKETGLHYNTFRYYAPDLGRFTQQDPIGLAGGINLYAYAPNPLTWVDPWGWSCGITGAISWKGFNPQKRDYNINGVVYQNLTGLQYHYKKHGREFGDITQIQYLNKAKEFAKKPITDTMQEAHINNIVIRYDKSTGEVFVGHAKKREMRTYYKDDGRDNDAFLAAIELAKTL